MSMSGGPSRSGERNRSNNSPSDTASALVIRGRNRPPSSRRTPALTEDVGPPAEVDDVPHDKEIPGKPSSSMRSSSRSSCAQAPSTRSALRGHSDGYRPLRPADGGTPSHRGRRDTGTAAGSERPRRGRTHSPSQARMPAAPHPGSAGTEMPVPPRTQVHAGRRQPTVDLVEAATARTAAIADASRFRATEWWWTLPVAMMSTPTCAASSAMASLRTESIGRPWSHSSTNTLDRPKSLTKRTSSCRAATGPSVMSAAGTGPLRQAVSTAQ